MRVYRLSPFPVLTFYFLCMDEIWSPCFLLLLLCLPYPYGLFPSGQKLNLFFLELLLVIVFYHGNRKVANNVSVHTHTHTHTHMHTHMHTTHMHNLCLHTSLSEGHKIDDFQAKKGRAGVCTGGHVGSCGLTC